ncbi:hypothetical protein C4D60_Mb01t03570 [Musa balbisiana]|uniref:Uncharacterized protein n=1 Tax=Musa balbisiana TaxID=52838 RepID=A0A4S8JJV1_MUSBA|nr:hypothetical protein C4D60_Mb01t03570 [Musa balbisiana]
MAVESERQKAKELEEMHFQHKRGVDGGRLGREGYGQVESDPTILAVVITANGLWLLWQGYDADGELCTHFANA